MCSNIHEVINSKDLSLGVEVLSCLSDVSRGHHVIPVLRLCSVLEEALSSCLDDVGVPVLVTHQGVVLVPLDVELCDSWSLDQDVSSELADVWFRGWVLVEFGVFVVVVDVVTNSEELMSLVGTGEQDASHSHNLCLWNPAHIRWLACYDKSSLTLFEAVSVHLLKDLVLVAITGLADVNDSPSDYQKLVRN